MPKSEDLLIDVTRLVLGARDGVDPSGWRTDDMPLSGDRKGQADALSITDNVKSPNTASRVSGEPSSAETKEKRKQLPDMKHAAVQGVTLNAVTDHTRASSETWALATRFEFLAMWLAIELPLVDLAAYFGLSVRQVERLRKDFGLGDRPALRRLGRRARQRLVTHETLAGFMTPRGQALLRVAQARRRVQDAARDVADREEAKRMWAWRRTPPPSEARHLREMFRRGLRGALLKG